MSIIAVEIKITFAILTATVISPTAQRSKNIELISDSTIPAIVNSEAAGESF